MSCEHPVLAYRYYRSDLGKSFLSFKVHVGDSLRSLEDKYGIGNVFEFGCGHCEDCRKVYAKEWSIRLTLEKDYWKSAYFLTLTYDDAHLPYADYSDMQKFIKLCRKYLGECAYFGCTEVGENTLRRHYHLILFTNSDIGLYDPLVKNGLVHYHSKFIDKHWRYGSTHDACKFTHYCGAYVAKYTTKDGNCFMSRNIGKRYWLDHYSDIVNSGFVIYGDFGKVNHVFCPKFMSQWFRFVDDLTIDDLKLFNSNIQRVLVNTRMRSIGSCYPEDLRYQRSRKVSKLRGGL